jgi:ABC-2 type transport system ATP-binding protein
MRVGEYLDFFGAAFGIPRKDRARRIKQVLEMAGASTFKDLYLEALSHGMKQRVAIARILLHDPEVLILDEPANGLDPIARIEMRELLLSLAEQGKTLLVTSHVLPELARVCHRVAIITRGQLRGFGTLKEISRQLSQLRSMEILLVRGDQLERAASEVRKYVGVGGEVQSSATEATIRFRTAVGEEGMAKILAALVNAGIVVEQFREVQTDLEEAYLTIAMASKQENQKVRA